MPELENVATGETRTIHMTVHLEGVLRDWPRWNGVLLREDGKPATRGEIQELVAQGVKKIPLGEPCEGFDPVKGCPGHTKETQS